MPQIVATTMPNSKKKVLENYDFPVPSFKNAKLKSVVASGVTAIILAKDWICFSFTSELLLAVRRSEDGISIPTPANSTLNWENQEGY